MFKLDFIPMEIELRSIRIKNCGPIEDTKIEFFNAAGKTLPVCVLGGANGSGKTTVLEMIFVLARIIPTHKITLPKPVEYAQLDLLVDKTPFSVFYGNPPDGVTREKEYVGFKPSIYQNSFELTSTALAGRLHQSINRKKAPMTNGDKPSDVGEQVPSFIYLPHNRSIESVAGSEIHKEATGYQFAYRYKVIKQFRGSLSSYLIWLDYAEPEQFAQTQQFLNELNFDSKTFHLNRKDLAVIVRTANGQEHRLDELSSGEQNLLIILTELRRRLLPHSIVLIDEIENSLHPAFQHMLAQGLLALQKEIPYQLIVTTHAPAFVEIFGAENTRILTQF